MPYKQQPTELEMGQMLKKLTETISPQLIVSTLHEMQRLAVSNPEAGAVQRGNIVQVSNMLTDLFDKLR